MYKFSFDGRQIFLLFDISFVLLGCQRPSQNMLQFFVEFGLSKKNKKQMNMHF